MAPTFRQMKQRARPSHIRALSGDGAWRKPQFRRAVATLERWGAWSIGPTETGQRLLAALRAEGRAA